jgi:hypothetical protein
MSALAQQTAPSTWARASRTSTATRPADAGGPRHARRAEPVPADGRRAGSCARRWRPRSSPVRPPLRPGQEITVTAGATQAILTAVLACVHPGDEVIVLEPCYDSYAQHRAGRRHRRARAADSPAASGPTSTRIAAALTPRTRAIIVNSPHNPSATVWTRRDAALAALLAPTDIAADQPTRSTSTWCSTASRMSAPRPSRRWRRAFVVSSFGKTFHVTGWKVGTVVAPAALTAEFRKVHQFNVFTVNTPMQHGLARFLETPRPTSNCRRSTSASATSSAPAWRARGCAAAQRRHLLPDGGLQRRERSARGRFLPVADTRSGVARDPAVGLLRRVASSRASRGCASRSGTRRWTSRSSASRGCTAGAARAAATTLSAACKARWGRRRCCRASPAA